MANDLAGQVDLGSATEGTPLPTTTDVASFTDANTGDVATSFTATIDWGDGNTTTGTVVGASGSFTVQGGNTYADDNFYQPVVTITRTTDLTQLVLVGGVSVADADNLAERLMADDQIIAAIRRCSVLKRGDFAIGAADSDVQHTHLDLSRRLDARFRLINELHLPASRKNGDSFHHFSIARGASRRLR